MGRCRWAGGGEELAQGGRDSAHQVPPSLHWQADAVEGNSAVWTPWNGEVVPCKGGGHGGEEHVL